MQLATLILCGFALLIVTVILLILLLTFRRDGQSELRMELNNSLQVFGKTISDNQRSAAEAQDKRLSGMEQSSALDFERLRRSQEERLSTLEQSNEQKLEAYEEEFMGIREKIMANENMKNYEAARAEIDAMMNYIVGLLTECVRGEDPETCEPPKEHECGGECSSCGGCH